MKSANRYPRKLIVITLGILGICATAQAWVDILIENDAVKYVLTPEGKNVSFSDKQTGKNWLKNAGGSFARVKKAGQYHDATAVEYKNGRLEVDFGAAGAHAAIQITASKNYFIWDVAAMTGDGIEELVMCDIPLSLAGEPAEGIAVCALAMNLQTRVDEIPNYNSVLRAMCYPRFGFVGARVGLIACPYDQMRPVMKEAIEKYSQLPYSKLAGPWASEHQEQRGSYLFDFGDISEKTVDDWIAVVQSLGFKQIDFHGGKSHRFGDCYPDPELYPEGFESLKRVIDKLHAAGIMAGLHTYAQFIDKKTPWVTPVPDPRLGKDATFTLAAAIGADAAVVNVQESTQKMSAITGFFERNSAIIQIDNELITYTGVQKEAPYSFTGCKRGALGTQAAEHAAGAKVHHLKECFGLLVPDGDSTLLAEVAAKTADAYNRCGFDMIYLDAIDGSDIMAGSENAWHYSAKFVFEILSRVKKPPVMEMSIFNHHLWFARSRVGAWDHPNRSHKTFIDMHCLSNAGGDPAMNKDHGFKGGFLPTNLGWWAVKTWHGIENEPTFPDDIEYLCGKAMGYDCSLALMGINPKTYHESPYMQRLATIFKNYETLRLANYFPEKVKQQLRQPGAEFTLRQAGDNQWELSPVRYEKQKIEQAHDDGSYWSVKNAFGDQPIGLRIEALLGAGGYTDAKNILLTDYSENNGCPLKQAAQGVTGSLTLDAKQVKDGLACGRLQAKNSTGSRESTWVEWSKKFNPPIDLKDNQAIGVWVCGDGKGEVLNFQMISPAHLAWGIAEHYVKVDFTGWRYITLVEPEGNRYADYKWPYGTAYSIYRENINPASVETLSIWVNNLPANDTIDCYISPVKAVPNQSIQINRPAVRVAGQTVTFPAVLASGEYLEFFQPKDCKHYGQDGHMLSEVVPDGQIPMLKAGENDVEFRCEASEGNTPRAIVTVISKGQPLPRN